MGKLSMARFAALALCLALATARAEESAVKRKLNVPPSADLSYAIKARQGGLALAGEALLQWRVEPRQFTVATETRAMLVGKILDTRSEGAIDEYGLAPNSFTERRFRKDPTVTTFDRRNKSISFSASGEIFPLASGAQDRSSAIWQLISIARAAPDRFKAGSEWRFVVAGQRDAEPWSFKVIAAETIPTELGELRTVHVRRAPPPDQKGQQLDIWLAPSLEWYPARLRFVEASGDVIEQSLVAISKVPG
jgi:hypothetical protein